MQILLNLIDRGMNPQEAIDASRVRVLGGNRISVEPTFESDVIARLASLGHQIIPGEDPPTDWMQPHDFLHSFMGSAQAIAIDPAFGALCGGLRSAAGWRGHWLLNNVLRDRLRPFRTDAPTFQVGLRANSGET